MAKNVRILTPDEMLEVAQCMPTFNEQLRARVTRAMADGTGVLTALCRKIDKARRFREKVAAYGKGDIPYLDLWEMLTLYAVMTETRPPAELQRAKLGRAGNGRKQGEGFPLRRGDMAPPIRKPSTGPAHPGLGDD